VEPLIIPRHEHCLSRRNVSREALKVLYRLKDNGYIAYLVGGGVRDLLLGKTPKDFDIGTNARPDEIRKLFRHSRCIGKRFKLVHVYFRGSKFIEVSTFRRRFDPAVDDINAPGNTTATVQQEPDEDLIYGTPQEDASRRDLTINGLFYNIADFSVIDYIGGMKDLESNTIRSIGDPDVRFTRDPVRMMRAIRHAARTGFRIETQTWQAILQHRDDIRLCSMARVRDEWLKDINSGFCVKWFDLMLESGLFYSLFPGHAKAVKDFPDTDITKLLRLMLQGIDNRTASAQTIPEALIMASLLFPCLSAMPEWNSFFEQTKIRFPLQDIKGLINEIELPYDFKKSVRDEAAYLLAGLSLINNCLKTENWPRRLKNRPDFNEMIAFYETVRAIDSEQLMPFETHESATDKNTDTKTRKKRKRRRKKPPESTNMQQEDIQNSRPDINTTSEHNTELVELKQKDEEKMP